MEVIKNYDVSSYYPSLMIQNGYTSRSIPSADLFRDVYTRRIQAKKDGNKPLANTLKLVLNTTYGATLSKFNPLYDPLKARSVCISGQLYLTELAVHLSQDVKSLKIVQLNTDGIMIQFDDSEYETVKAITDEWQKRTGFGLEEDAISSIVQKDVNNYVMVQPDGHVKAKGGYVVKGISPAGAFNVNNNAVIVADAIKAYFVDGTPPEETVNACDDMSKFQMIAKSGKMYRESYHLVNGEKFPIQKVNRVYASKDPKYGKLYKVKEETDSEAKIDSLPEHCIIDNDNHLTIHDVDKQFYIDMANKRINDFLGIEPEKPKKGRKPKMAEKKPLNVYQKLLNARISFLQNGVEKSGKNNSLKFRYFELDDIVPVANKIFAEQGLLPVVCFSADTAMMTIHSTDDPEDCVVFAAPLKTWEGNAAVNPMQAFGASVTYYRRYLYMIALDICEADDFEANLGGTVQENVSTPVTVKLPEKKEPEPVQERKVPMTPVERAEIKEQLTDANGNATELQINSLKTAFRNLIGKHPEERQWVTGVAIQTESFTKISKTDCETLIQQIQEKLK